MKIGEFAKMTGMPISVLRHYNHTACAYEIVTKDDTDYMIIEWKSGDYRWGGYDTSLG